MFCKMEINNQATNEQWWIGVNPSYPKISKTKSRVHWVGLKEKTSSYYNKMVVVLGENSHLFI